MWSEEMLLQLANTCELINKLLLKPNARGSNSPLTEVLLFKYQIVSHKYIPTNIATAAL